MSQLSGMIITPGNHNWSVTPRVFFSRPMTQQWFKGKGLRTNKNPHRVPWPQETTVYIMKLPAHFQTHRQLNSKNLFCLHNSSKTLPNSKTWKFWRKWSAEIYSLCEIITPAKCNSNWPSCFASLTIHEKIQFCFTSQQKMFEQFKSLPNSKEIVTGYLCKLSRDTVSQPSKMMHWLWAWDISGKTCWYLRWISCITHVSGSSLSVHLCCTCIFVLMAYTVAIVAFCSHVAQAHCTAIFPLQAEDYAPWDLCH